MVYERNRSIYIDMTVAYPGGAEGAVAPPTEISENLKLLFMK